MYTPRLRYLALVLLVALLAASALACDLGGGPSKPTITITAPTSDAQFEEGEEVNILSSANDAKGVVRVELLVDGDLYRTDSTPSAEGEKSLAMAQTWRAADPGMHTISVIAYNVDGAASDPWAVTIEVVGAGGVVTPPTPTSPGPPPAATNTPPPPPPEATATTPPPPEDTPEPDLPDLVLDGLRVVPSTIEEGDSVQVSVDIGNYGSAPSGPYTVVWRYGAAGPDYCEWNKGPLPPMNGGTLNCTVEMYESYTTVAEVDWEGTVDESNDDNNRMEFFVRVEPRADLPDLYISEIRVQPTSPEQGSPAMVGVRIHNQGGVEARNFRVKWLSAEPGEAGLEWAVSSLAPGGSNWVQNQYTYTGHGHFNTRAIVDYDRDVDETDEDNNEMTKGVDVVPS